MPTLSLKNVGMAESGGSMEDLKTAAWMLRYGSRSLAHNLDFIQEEYLDW